ncbi:MAG: TetR/AcrR family transcriptional regulator [Gemmataceae bacterium]|jgi:AcrR family transcriptional regulator|nr:TetR/AcrR family transcriptional regulator [Gemmataceae bacterium]
MARRVTTQNRTQKRHKLAIAKKNGSLTKRKKSASSKKEPATESVIADTRREQIISSTMAIISSEGIHRLSLSKIEKRAKMHRGQLTYYFPTKEAILLAVFDRMLMLIHERMGRTPCTRRGIEPAWECVQKMLKEVMGSIEKNQDYQALQYTFLAQVAYRDDYKKKLASVYGEMRSIIGSHWFVSGRPKFRITASPKTVGAFVQALVHGLMLQLTADRNAFDRNEMIELCVQTLSPLFSGGDNTPAEEART